MISQSELIKESDKNNKNNYTYSNDALYGLCSGLSIMPDPGCTNKTALDKFASVMLIIGRTYSASPERRKTAKNNDYNNGSGNFFNDLACHAVAIKTYKAMYDKLKNIANKKYHYDNGSHDYELLTKSLVCVSLFNQVLVEAICLLDKKKALESLGDTDRANFRDNYSFCSKFLHFVLPDIFFIKDTISLYGAKKIYENLKDKEGRAKPNQWVKESVKQINVPLIEKTRNNTKEYANHIFREYSIASVLNCNNIKPIAQVKEYLNRTNNDPVCSMPRLVDAVVMNSKS